MKDLIRDLQQKVVNSDLPTGTVFKVIRLIGEIESLIKLPKVEASRVRENEQAKEVCCMDCDNLHPGGFCATICENYSGWKSKQTG